jgi:hypothetical protein
MYPTAELKTLEVRKLVLRQKIAASRLECAALAERASRPVALLDRVITQWRKISPLAKIAAVPLGFMLRRKLLPRKGSLFRSALRWAPAVLSAMRMAKARSS